MIRKRRWLWITLFIFTAIVWITLATGWNVVLVHDYHQMLQLAKSVSAPSESLGMAPWPIVILGSLGFAAVFATWILFFIKVLREMKLNQLQAEFLATVSHELKTPIASIELSSSLLKAGGLTEEEIKQLWDSHQLELKRLRSEVEAILEAARWQARPMRPRNEVLDLEAWLSDSMQRWRSILGSKADLVREGDSLPRRVKMDSKSLNLITDNLLDNARKFSRGNPRVIVRTERIGKKRPLNKTGWKIEFHDEGWGFDPAESTRIFRRFFRGHHDAPYSIPGTGLGLYLAHAASRGMGLKLRAHSAGLGKGAVFTLQGAEKRAQEALH